MHEETRPSPCEHSFCSLRGRFRRKTRGMMRFPLAALLCFCFLMSLARGAEPFLRQDDVIALVGGENMVAVSENGFFELYLTSDYPDFHLRFRNLAWEGDTVFEQNRDLNFPTWEEQLDKIGATVVIAQFGQMESLAGKEKLPAFIAAYEKLIERWSAGSKRRLVLVSPILFGQSASAMKEKGENEGSRQIERLKSHNETLDEYIEAIRDLAESHHARFVNVSNLDVDDVLVQRDGIHLTATGQYLMARRWAEGVGAKVGNRPMEGGISRLRQVIIAKNRLWFNYWRVQNWAFLAGDRTNQPSSRDWRDPSIRWFPPEREQFVPLIEAQEKAIWEQAAELR